MSATSDAEFFACMQIIEQGDPHRFRTLMTLDLSNRRVLAPVFAMNVKIAEAPWVSTEPMIAEMRLQWWADALGEIAQSAPVRAHEVTTPLSKILAPQMAQELLSLVEARRWDIYDAPFKDVASFEKYLKETYGTLFVIAGALVGDQAPSETSLSLGYAQGLARFLTALPKLSARGKNALPSALQISQDATTQFLEKVIEEYRSAPRTSRVLRVLGYDSAALLAQAQRAKDTLSRSEIRLNTLHNSWLLLRARGGF